MQRIVRSLDTARRLRHPPCGAMHPATITGTGLSGAPRDSLTARTGLSGAPRDSLTARFRVSDAFALPGDDETVVARAAREQTYPIHVTRDATAARDRLAELLAPAETVAIISDETVDALYGNQLRAPLRGLGHDVIAHTVPAGEASKSLEQAVALWHWLAESRLGRRDVVLSFGGGVICDLGGWVASAYMRGIPYVNLPTTLLAMVDGALGGKV